MKELSALNRYFVRYAGSMLFGVACIVLSNIVGVYVAVFVRQGLNDGLQNARLFGDTRSALMFELSLTTAFMFGVAIVLVAVFKGFLMYWMRQSIVVVSRKVEYDLKNDIYSHYQKLGLDFYRQNFTGDMMARIGEDVSNVRMYVGPAVMYFANILFVFITVISQMFMVNTQLTMIVLVPLPFLSWGIYKVSRIINERNTAIQTQLSALTTLAQETFAGIRVIKAFGAESRFGQEFNTAGKKYRFLNMRLAMVNSLFFPLMVLLVGLSSLLVLYIGGTEVSKGGFTPGNIAEFLIYLNMLIWPVASLGWTTALVQKAAASQKRINEFLQHPAANNDEGLGQFELKKEISIKNLSFTYPGAQQQMLKNLNLSIEAGTVLGITGKTGSGKSTLAQLLMRQYEPDGGSIESDGIEFTQFSRTAFMRAMAYIPQDQFLFSDSIAQNIAFGIENAETDDETIRKAALLAGLGRDISQWPNGLETIIGERGVSLSGGQKQRVCIARALIRDAEMYVFDDCLSAVDAETESEIIESFLDRLKGKTAVIISHRITPLKLADKIIVLEHGQIAEEGSFKELISGNAYFAKMYQLQSAQVAQL
jgi:ATP-binding cassette subfamily B protein